MHAVGIRLSLPGFLLRELVGGFTAYVDYLLRDREVHELVADLLEGEHPW